MGTMGNVGRKGGRKKCVAQLNILEKFKKEKKTNNKNEQQYLLTFSYLLVIILRNGKSNLFYLLRE